MSTLTDEQRAVLTEEEGRAVLDGDRPYGTLGLCQWWAMRLADERIKARALQANAEADVATINALHDKSAKAEAAAGEVRAGLQWVAQQPCDRAHPLSASVRVCPDSGDCVTEWYLPCASQARLDASAAGVGWVSPKEVAALRSGNDVLKYQVAEREKDREVLHRTVDSLKAKLANIESERDDYRAISVERNRRCETLAARVGICERCTGEIGLDPVAALKERCRALEGAAQAVVDNPTPPPPGWQHQRRREAWAANMAKLSALLTPTKDPAP